jgi:glycerol-3-phosphate dehydrogenase
VSFTAVKLLTSRKAHFRVYATHDVMGCEIAGAVKNVLAIASGAAHAMGLGMNARAGMLCRGLAEMKRLALACGSSGACLSGLAGVGDLMLTCSSELSRNFSVGARLAAGGAVDVAAGVGAGGAAGVAEGVLTAKSIKLLCEQRGVEMPICGQVFAVLYENKPVPEALKALMERPLSVE